MKRIADIKLLLTGILFTLGLLYLTTTAAAQTVPVGNVEQLYAAVNDPANAGSTLDLAPGIYTLSVNDPNGVARPNKGRLELQTDMSITGVANDRSAVVIDPSLLPDGSFLDGTRRTGTIRIGRGTNSVEWLTVLGNSSSAGSVETDLASSAATVRIAHIVSNGSARGFDIRNFGPASSGRTIDAEAVDNEVYNGAEGFRAVNQNNVTGGIIRLRLEGNRSHDNEFGCVIENNGSSLSSVTVRSYGDRLYNNGGGCVIGAALIGGPVGNANGNTTDFEAHGCKVINNKGPWSLDRGGILALGAETPALAGHASSNTLNIRLWGCTLSGNQFYDLQAYGARGIVNQPGGISGTYNTATIELHGVSKFVDPVLVYDSLPSEPNATNSVTIIR
jgi:hypothetical protein